MKNQTFKYLIGIDEVGRGPVAGPVAVCVSLVRFNKERVDTLHIKDLFNEASLNQNKKLPALRDSKKLTEKGRELWFSFLEQSEGMQETTAKEIDVIFSLGYSSAKEIDEKGIAVCIKSLVASGLNELKEKVKFNPEEVLVLLDGGLKAPEDFIHQETIIKGDDKEPIISFASIYAKVSRDRLMVELSRQYPQYSLEKHKGYGTKVHMDAIKQNGMTELHRRSFLTGISG